MATTRSRFAEVHHDIATGDPAGAAVPSEPPRGRPALIPAPGGPPDEDLVTGAARPPIRLRVACPCAEAVQITVVGEVVGETLDRLKESWPHRSRQLRILIIDVTSSRGLRLQVTQLLTWAWRQAQTDRLELRLVAGDRLRRQLHLAGWDRHVACYPTRAATLPLHPD